MTLKLVLKKKWFDMINSGNKTEEYRDYKPYWINRILCKREKYEFVTFYHGYSANRPSMTFRILDIIVATGFINWGAQPNNQYIVIRLGERIL